VSRQVIGHVIQQLLTDEDLRVRFALDPDDTIADLMCQGCELTAEEVEILVRTDPRLWFWNSALVGEQLH